MTTTTSAQTQTAAATDDLQVIQTPPTMADAQLLVQLQIAATMSGAFRGFDLLRTFDKPPTLAQLHKRYPRGSEEAGQISAFMGNVETMATFVRQGLLNEALVNDLYAVAFGWTWIEKIAKGLRRETGEAREYENAEWLAKRATAPIR